jgi:cohesin complex subunit SA-1/2
MRPATGASKKSSRPRKAPIRKSILAGDETEGLYGRHITFRLTTSSS